MERAPHIPARIPVHLWLTLLAVLVAGAFVDVMEVDAAQYATMSRDMLGQADPLKLYFRGADYLDKPPLLFWTSALSFSVFGVHNWSYKLPSILAALAACPLLVVVASLRTRLWASLPTAGMRVDLGHCHSCCRSCSICRHAGSHRI